MQAVGGLVVPDIVATTYIAVPPLRVYQALTDASTWDAWFTNGTTLDPRPGGEMVMRWRNWGPGDYTLDAKCQVVEAVEPTSFAFSWTAGTAPTTIRFSIEARGAGTVLSVNESGYPMTQKDLDAQVDCAAGWGEALTLLKFYLEHGLAYGKVPPA